MRQPAVLLLVVVAVAGCASGRGAVSPRAPEPPPAHGAAGETMAVEEATFAFAPPDGLVCHERRRQVVRKDAGTAGGTTEDVTDAVVRHRFVRTPAGWRVTSQTLSAEVVRNGTPVTDPVTAALVGRELVYEVGEDGALRAVRGLEDLGEAAARFATPDLRDVLRRMLDPTILAERERTEWQRRIGDLVGRRVRVGEIWEGQAEIGSQSGSMPVVTLTRFSHIAPRDGRILVRLDFAYAGDRETARRRLEETDRVGAGRKPPVAVRPGQDSRPVVIGGGSRVIEASTMTVLSEQLRQVTVASTELAGMGRVRLERTDVREAVFDCTVPGAAR